jgi:spore coat protein U-like protein
VRELARLWLCLIIAVGLTAKALAGSPADPATATFNVSITIVKECAVSTAPSNINLGTFGAVSLLTSNATATMSFSVMCSAGIPFTIGFSSGNDLSPGSTTHQMIGTGSNTHVVQYVLTDVTAGAGNTTPLSGSSSLISGTGTGAALTKTIQAQVINYSTAVTPDTYTDVVTLSVSY